jgi:3-hydroxyacyl-CoA dehydrogenase
MRMAARASERAATDHASSIQPFLQRYFEMIAMAEVAESAEAAVAKHLLPAHTRVVMHADRRLHVAKAHVVALSEEGYRPPPRLTAIRVLGQPTLAAMKIALQQYRDGGYISEYDQFLATKLGYVMTGGALSAPQTVHEDYLIDLEREVFLSLLGEEKTQARVRHILEHNKPLRN